MKIPAFSILGIENYPKIVLLDLSFFVDHVLANNWIKFLDFHLVRHSPLVLISGVVVTRLGTRNQLNQISHNRCLYIYC